MRKYLYLTLVSKKHHSTFLVFAGVIRDLHDPKQKALSGLADGVETCDGGILGAESLQEELHVAVMVMAKLLRLLRLWLRR